MTKFENAINADTEEFTIVSTRGLARKPFLGLEMYFSG